MSVADRDRVVFQQYAEELGPALSGVWRRERARCVLRRAAQGLFTAYARAGLTMVGLNPAAIKPRDEVRLDALPLEVMLRDEPPADGTPPGSARG